MSNARIFFSFLKGLHGIGISSVTVKVSEKDYHKIRRVLTKSDYLNISDRDEVISDFSYDGCTIKFEIND